MSKQEEFMLKIVELAGQISRLTTQAVEQASHRNNEKFFEATGKILFLTKETDNCYKEMTTTSVEAEARRETDAHTEHCCIHCGCKYGEDRPDPRDDSELGVGCSVVSKRKKQSYPCKGDCRDHY